MKISYLNLLLYQACTHSCKHLSVPIVYAPKIQFTFTYRNAQQINLKILIVSALLAVSKGYEFLAILVQVVSYIREFDTG